jgi:hypothetical protein
MTRWQHFKHAFGLHDWKEVRQYDVEARREKCGPFDPGPATRPVTMVDVVCCQCNEPKTMTWREWVGI